MSLIHKIRTEVLPKAVEEGKFGSDKVKFVDFQLDDDLVGEDQFCATVLFGDVISETNTGDRVVQSVVVKTQTDATDLLSADRNKFGVAIQLYSEFLFYEEILPLLRKCDTSGHISTLFPRYFYGSVSQGDPTDDFLIFENVQKLGFKLSSSKQFIDYDHIELTLRAVAQFHALSLVCKRKYPHEFKRVVSKISECHWTDIRLKATDGFYRENAKRGVIPLRDDPECRDKLGDLWSIIDGMDFTMAKIVTPVEPLAVVCHGDFCRNNFFYKYDSGGSPVQVMFFDMATIRYASPVIDLSFFLYMNSSPELRSTRWKDILLTYHSTLISNLQPEDNPPSFEDFKTDFRRRGFYGYAHASFFLPMMLVEKPERVDEWWNSDIEQLIKIRLATGGEEATQLVTEIVRHMIDEAYDFKYIVDFKLKKNV